MFGVTQDGRVLVVPFYECVTPEELTHLKRGAAFAFETLEAKAVPLTDEERAWFETELKRIEATT